jgi:hypothetical protein
MIHHDDKRKQFGILANLRGSNDLYDVIARVIVEPFLATKGPRREVQDGAWLVRAMSSRHGRNVQSSVGHSHSWLGSAVSQ